MSRLLESIRYENGHFNNIAAHQERVNRSRKALYGITKTLNLEAYLQDQKRPSLPGNQVYKCRIIYGKTIESVEFLPYQFPKIKTLQCVYDDSIQYAFKYLNRQQINQLYEQRGAADDILLVTNGLISDSSFANLIFFNCKQWLTPAHPLLEGTQRKLLLEQERIFTAEIRMQDLKYFNKIQLINAMIGMTDNQIITNIIP